ncbi:MAG TPA: DUF4270 domain-containing protein [Paludibacter sp.]
MKSHSIVLLFLLSLLTFSCTDNLTNLGNGIQPVSDQINVGTDTFHVSTENIFVDSMFTRQDSFLLGSFYDEKYGSTQADILAQVNCPIDFKYPPGSIADSALVVLYYRSWFGDQYSPMDVNIYEMNKKTFSYPSLYPTNLDPADYTNRSIKLGQRIFKAKDPTRIDSTSIIFKLSSDFVNRFFNDTYYTSSSKFIDFFKGLYITPNFGSATMLNIKQIDLEFYSHYTYTKAGADTLTKVNNVIIFPANSEVRQVNRFLHPDKALIKQKLAQRDSVNYVSSPTNIQTQVTLPLNRMKQRMDVGINNKKLTLNSALLRVEATEVDEATLAQPIVSYMMLIKESAVDRFFNKNELPSDTCAIRGTYTTSQIGTTGVYENYYTFDVASLVANELKIAKENNTNPAENLKMRLVPVRVAFNSSSVLTSVKQQFLMSAVTIRSGKNTKSPMRIKVVYSGF